LNKSINNSVSVKKRGKKKYMFFYIILAVIILAVITPIINPIRRTDKALRKHLLSIIPIGTSMEEVIRIIEGHNCWIIERVEENYGVVLDSRDMYPLRSAPTTFRNSKVIGEQAVWIDLGSYYGIFKNYVSAHLAFDENEELIDIFIRREPDVI